MPPPRPVAPDRLFELLGAPTPTVVAKIRPEVDHNGRTFIARSPLAFLATSNADGELDCSPRGDPAGFVQVLDDRTLVIPDRPGNRLAQSFRNIAEHPQVGLIFLIPDVQETYRVNGRAYLTDEPAVLADMAVNGRTPNLAVVVSVEEAYIHCGKALLRAGAWQADASNLAEGLPSIGTFLAAAAAAADASAAEGPALDVSAAEVDEYVAGAYRKLY